MELECSLYPNCIDCSVSKIGLFSWLEGIKNGRDKAEVEAARQFHKEGNEAKVAQIKQHLRTIIPTGFMPNGRKKDDVINLNGVCWVDIDIHDPEWSLQAINKLRDYPGIIGAHRTLRGGLHIFILMPKGVTLKNYGFIQRVILEEIDRMLECEHDNQCITLSHLCSTSYDPEAFIANPDELKEFPYEGVLKRNQKEVYEILNNMGNQTELNEEDDLADGNANPKGNVKQTKLMETLSKGPSFDEVMGCQHHAYSKVQLDDHFQRFLGRYPLIQGQRHNNLLHLGQYAHFMRYNANEVDYLIDMSVKYLFDPEFNRKHVQSCICWGYAHNDKQIDLVKFTKQEFMGIRNPNGDAMSQMSHVSLGGDYEEMMREQEAEFEGHYNNTVKSSCPYFSNSVYENLPQIIKKLLSKSDSKREQDILTINALAAISAALPKVEVRCRKKDYSPHLFILTIGPTGSGKGIAEKSAELLYPLQERMDRENEIKRDTYEKELFEWESEKKRFVSQGGDLNWSRRPEQPKMQTLILEANTSNTQFLTRLAENPDGLYVSATELKHIINSMKSDAGRYQSIFNCSAMNEKIGFDYKNASRSVRINRPKLALSAQGTLPQYAEFVGNEHEGLESRAMALLTSETEKFQCWGDEDENDKVDSFNQAYQEVGKELIKIHDYLAESPTHVFVPKQLRSLCDAVFSAYLERLNEEHFTPLGAIVKRAPILVARLCSIFCALRKYEMALPLTVMEPTEEEVLVALDITSVLIRHTTMAASMIVPSNKKLCKITNVFKAETFFEDLPKEFATAEMLDLCYKNLQISRAQANRILSKWMDDGWVERHKKGFYRKTGKMPI